ncbi:hypothetical protein AHF37_04243 [Paragonimus kellicotti]|nr:hypothetical protein AHF37_04243 [Paragonimus kellicotti]
MTHLVDRTHCRVTSLLWTLRSGNFLRKHAHSPTISGNWLVTLGHFSAPLDMHTSPSVHAVANTASVYADLSCTLSGRDRIGVTHPQTAPVEPRKKKRKRTISNEDSSRCSRCHHDTKINTSITFPADLDLAPYLSHVDGGQSAWQDRYSLYAVVNHSGQTNSGHYTAYIRSAPGSWCLCDDQKIVYSLYAVVNHSGQTNSGHYTAYIRSAPGSWCLCDDQKIVSVSLEHVLRTDAYVLLYHKNLLAIRA